MLRFTFFIVLLIAGRCSLDLSTGTLQHFYATSARDDGGGHYYAVPASCATLHWNVIGADTVYITDPAMQVLGPFPASGTLRTQPIHWDMHYTLYIGGIPGNFDGLALVFDSPASPQYPGNQGNGYVDPSCE